MKKKKKPKTANLKYENSFLRYGCETIVGIDEVGYGALAGPVVVGAVCLPLKPGTRNLNLKTVLSGLRDSKDMTVSQRETLVKKIEEVATAHGIGSASAEEIDEHGMSIALRKAMSRALEKLTETAPEDFKIDCVFLEEVPWPEMAETHRLIHIVEGDKRSLTIAAASVLAKTWRDTLMVSLSEQYPEHGFAAHKGYGTQIHRRALREHGVTPIHRKSYKPVMQVLKDS